jgi:hypothetical protein
MVRVLRRFAVGLLATAVLVGGGFAAAEAAAGPGGDDPHGRKLARVTAGRPSVPEAVRPPSPQVSTLDVTRTATLFTYCWTQARPGGGERGVCADGAPGRPAQTLRWRPGVAVTVDLRLPAHNVQIGAVRIRGGFGGRQSDLVHLRARRVDQAGRRWVIRLPRRAGRDTDLLISARFANGDLGADLGLQRR